MDTLKHCVIAICAATLIIALGGVYCSMNYLPEKSDFLWFTGIILAVVVVVYFLCIGLVYLLTLKLEENRAGELEKEFQRKKEWAEFELELREKETSFRKDWKIFEQELLLAEKDNDSRRSINEKEAELRRSIEEKNAELQRVLEEKDKCSQQNINERNATFNRWMEAKKAGISIQTSYDPSK